MANRLVFSSARSGPFVFIWNSAIIAKLSVYWTQRRMSPRCEKCGKPFPLHQNKCNWCSARNEQDEPSTQLESNSPPQAIKLTMVSAWIRVISFHLALFFTASGLLIFSAFSSISIYGMDETTSILLSVGIAIAITALISRASRACFFDTWLGYTNDNASFLIFLGHAGPGFGAYFLFKMMEAGTGSGLIFLPLIVWTVVFYGAGLLKAFSGLEGTAKPKRSA